jgi:hypothetical protein
LTEGFKNWALRGAETPSRHVRTRPPNLGTSHVTEAKSPMSTLQIPTGAWIVENRIQ